MAASVALIAFVAGLAAAGWASVDDAPATHAGLFGPPVVDLQLQRSGGVNAFVGASNMAPGDRTSGTLRVLTAGPLPGGVHDLDFDVRLDAPPVQDGRRLADVLLVTRLAYGSDDLLSSRDGGRNVLREIDANPLLGNGDGKLSLRELQAGANDLPAPRSRADGGTGFSVEVAFDPAYRGSSDAFAHQSVRASFVFQLADLADADLN